MPPLYVFFLGFQAMAVCAEGLQVCRIVVLPQSILMMDIELAYVFRHKSTPLAG
jgi:hypothetical protein